MASRGEGGLHGVTQWSRVTTGQRRERRVSKKRFVLVLSPAPATVLPKLKKIGCVSVQEQRTGKVVHLWRFVFVV